MGPNPTSGSAMDKNDSPSLLNEEDSQQVSHNVEPDIINTPVKRKSRLAKNFERRTIRNTILMALGIILIVFILVKFGISFLIGFSTFLGSGGQSSQAPKEKQIGYIPPPVLNPLPTATNSAHIVISGESMKDQTINLYINDDLKDKVLADNNGNFTFSQQLSLGDNLIKVKAEKDSKQSDFSNSFNITYSNSQPKLEVSSPTDGQSFSKDQNPITVSGKTDSNISVTVNGFWAIIDDNNNFSYSLSLQNGENQIKIVAIDQAGNKTEKSLKVNYSQ